MRYLARNALDDALDEAAALAETLSLKLEAARQFRRSTHQPEHGWREADNRPAGAGGGGPSRIRALMSSVGLAVLAVPQLGARAFGNRGVLTGAMVAGAVTVVGTAHLQSRWRALAELEARTVAVSVRYSDGSVRGVVAPTAPLTTRNADGSRAVRVTLPVEEVPSDFMRLVGAMEGDGVLGVDWPALAISIGCYVASEKLGVTESEALRLTNGRCAGSSTPLMQAARTLRDTREYSVKRKCAEVLDAVALALFLGARKDRFVADTLEFGASGGRPLIGHRAAAQTVFGREPHELALHEQALLAAMLKRPARLYCGGSGDLYRFEEQRDRARYWLRKEFEGDPRLAEALTQLDAMPAVTSPAPLAAVGGPTACRANLHPLRRLEQLDRSVLVAVERERDALVARGIHPREIELSIDWPAQQAFLAAVGQNRVRMAAQGGWIVDPRSHDLAVLAFDTRPTGHLRTLYEPAGFEAQLFGRRELGSLGKLAALAFLAEQGWKPDEPLCNRAWDNRHNAGGDPGKPSCASRDALIPIERAVGQSLSLAIREALARYPQDALRSRMEEWGFTLPTDGPPAYSISFGLTQATPARMAAFAAALSNGIAGRPAIAREPTVIARFRDGAGVWHDAPQGALIDLRRAFATAAGREAITRGAGAALSYRGAAGPGTLVALGAPLAGEVAKSGTLDDEAGQTRFKAAVGARGGAAWFVMAAPQRGALGGNGVSVIPLAKTARQAAVVGGSVPDRSR